MAEFIANLNAQGINVSNARQEKSSGSMKLDLEPATTNVIARQSFTTLIEKAFEDLKSAKNENMKTFGKGRINELLSRFERIGGNASEYRARLGKE